jgi:hypothetical protein
VRKLDSSPLAGGILETAYFGLFLLALPFAFIENASGFGGTIWIKAKRVLQPNPVGA